MLYPANDYLLYVIKEQTIRHFRREVEIAHLLGELHPQQPSWLSCQMRQALHSLGHTFLTLGQRLDRIETNAT